MPRSFAANSRRQDFDAPAAGRRDGVEDAEKERNVKHFLIKYRLKNGSPETWHQDIVRFITALDGDPALRGKISYRCMKGRDGSDYYHLAAAADEQAIKALQSREFFSRYTEQTKLAAGGEVEVLPLEIIAETVGDGRRRDAAG
jgi:hypothetical protein